MKWIPASERLPEGGKMVIVRSLRKSKTHKINFTDVSYGAVGISGKLEIHEVENFTYKNLEWLDESPASTHPEEPEGQEEKKYSEAEVLDLLAAFKMSVSISDPMTLEDIKEEFPNVFNHKRLDALKWITITRKK